MSHTREGIALSILRISLGLIFFWAFIDKLFGLGFATKPASAWINGGSPTTGFLKGAVYGPLANMFHTLSGSVFVDWLFMIGLLCIGLSLIFGIGMRVATVTGSIMLLLMWLALLPPKNHPFLDDHLVYIFALSVLYHNAGSISLAKWWKEQGIVRKFGWLE